MTKFLILFLLFASFGSAQLPKPIISARPAEIEVKIACEVGEAYYTIDGSVPTVESGKLYTGTFFVVSGTTVQAICAVRQQSTVAELTV